MSYTFEESRKRFAIAQKTIAGGINSGIRLMEKPVPLYFTHGKGSRIWDVDGNEYIDYQIGQGAILYGHAPDGMVEALCQQAAKGVHWAAQCDLETGFPALQVSPQAHFSPRFRIRHIEILFS